MSIAIDEAARRGDSGKSTRQQLLDAVPPAHGSSSSGKVCLVGAGPGDPELITLKGLRYLRAADVVVYDRLINLSLLDEVRPGAERVFAGKEPGCHPMK